MKQNVLLAGVPAGIGEWLQLQLDVAVRTVASRASAGAVLRSSWPSLLVIGEGEGAGEELVRDVRSDPATARLPIVYCLGREPESGLAARLVRAYGVNRLIVDPPRRPALAEAVAALIPLEVQPRTGGTPNVGKLSEGMEALWQRFQAPTLQRVDTLEEAGRAIACASLDEESRRNAEREAHKLAGSVGTFGFSAGSDLARTIEQILAGCGPIPPEEVKLYLECVAMLRVELEGPGGEGSASSDHRTTGNILVVDATPEFGAGILSAATGAGVSVTLVSSDSAPRRLMGARPELVIIDAAPRDRWATRIELLRLLAASEPPIPALIIGKEDAGMRWAAVLDRRSTAFLRAPITADEVLTEGLKLLGDLKPDRGRILVVDDDPQVLEVIRTILGREGYDIEDVGDPLQFMQEMENPPPDLLILDLDMPSLSGIELCWLVRGNPTWQGVPIVLLTAHRAAEVVQRVFAAGADDFVLKPLVGPELLTRVANRLERARLYRTMAETDALTGVANRRKSTERFHQLHRLAQRNNQPLTFALLDLDRFKQVNDRYGHAIGDRVLREFSSFLLRIFREEDIIGRWGGEEFIVGLYGTNRVQAAERLSEAIEDFRRIAIDDGAGGSLHVTFSGGIAEYPTDGLDLQSLYLAADKALYRAKETGRARVLAVGAEDRAAAIRLAEVLAPVGGHAA